MKIKFKKGDKLLAVNTETKDITSFTCPADNICKQVLTRYVVMHLDLPAGKYIFTKQ